MDLLNVLKIIYNSFFKKKSKARQMKRVFQWRRYLEWKNLAPEEQLSAKRFLLIPIFAYLINGILNKNYTLIVLFLIGYVLYKKFEKGDIVKK